MTVKYSLAMIVRNCAADLKDCLESFARYPDDIVIVNTALSPEEEGYAETRDVALRYGARHFDFPWLNDFSKARNFSFSKARHDVVLWLDSDDVVEEPELFDGNVREGVSKGATWLLVDYMYEHDEAGNCTTRLLRERVVDRRYFEWRAPIHECLCQTWKGVGGRIPFKGGRIRHTQFREETEEIKGKLERNLGVFEKSFAEAAAEPRMLFYWGNTLVGLHRYDDALAKYEEYLKTEPNPKASHVPVVLNAMSECYRIKRQPEKALSHALRGVAWNPMLPTAWVQAAEASLMMEDYERAVMYAHEASTRQEHQAEEMVTNPRSIEGRPPFIEAVALVKMGQPLAAREPAQKALQVFPNDKMLVEILTAIQGEAQRANLLGAFTLLCSELQKEGAPQEKVRHFAESVPASLKHLHEVHRLIPKVRPDGKRSMAFLAPGGVENWGPDSIEKGIGGSEEAVINMAREFARKGWHTEVYNLRHEHQVDPDGVHWYPYWQWTGENDTALDVAIWWRNPMLPAQFGANAKTNYLWLHDMPTRDAWTLDGERFFDSIFVLSGFHQEQYDFLKNANFLHTHNAIDADLLVPLSELKNNPHRLIWGSDPQRGLQNLLPWWDYIRERVPDAELHVYYGWTPLFHVHRQQQLSFGSDHLEKLFQYIEEASKKPGIAWMGRVGQSELNRAYSEAGIWAYPTEFPEISCITAMKAQAQGAIPVCTDDFALKETVQHGYKVQGPMSDPGRQKILADTVVDLMLHPERQAEIRKEMVGWARQITWTSVAHQWEALFLRDLGSFQVPRHVRKGQVQALQLARATS